MRYSRLENCPLKVSCLTAHDIPRTLFFKNALISMWLFMTETRVFLKTLTRVL